MHDVVDRIQARAQQILATELNIDAQASVRFVMTLSEVCQNVVEHAGRGGWVAVQTYRWRQRLGRRVVQIAVCDAGIGFRRSLESMPGRVASDRWDDGSALEEAVIRGVSRFRDRGRGQGLAGARNFLGKWDGKLSVRSGTARIAIVPPWDDDVPLRENLARLPWRPSANHDSRAPDGARRLMVHHVDLGSVLRRSVSDLYTNLVTRPTGAAVRAEIEQQLAAQSLGERSARLLAIIDFAHVGLLDYSCADEVVAKLLLRYVAPGVPHDAPHDAYFVLRGAQEAHVDAIETALARYGLALVAEGAGPAGDVRLVGAVPDDERRVWDAVYRLGTTDAGRRRRVPRDRRSVPPERRWRRAHARRAVGPPPRDSGRESQYGTVRCGRTRGCMIDVIRCRSEPGRAGRGVQPRPCASPDSLRLGGATPSAVR